MCEQQSIFCYFTFMHHSNKFGGKKQSICDWNITFSLNRPKSTALTFKKIQAVLQKAFRFLQA